jgi:rubredoxin
MWECSECGYVHEGEWAPDRCPRCEAGKAAYMALDAEDVERIQRASFANSLHMHLFSLLEDARDIADAGVEDNLDPRCVAIFQEVESFATQLQHKISAELASHMEEGKWG